MLARSKDRTARLHRIGTSHAIDVEVEAGGGHVARRRQTEASAGPVTADLVVGAPRRVEPLKASTGERTNLELARSRTVLHSGAAEFAELRAVGDAIVA